MMSGAPACHPLRLTSECQAARGNRSSLHTARVMLFGIGLPLLLSRRWRLEARVRVDGLENFSPPRDQLTTAKERRLRRQSTWWRRGPSDGRFPFARRGGLLLGQISQDQLTE
jgi:hypothetical protein